MIVQERQWRIQMCTSKPIGRVAQTTILSTNIYKKNAFQMNE